MVRHSATNAAGTHIQTSGSNTGSSGRWGRHRRCCWRSVSTVANVSNKPRALSVMLAINTSAATATVKLAANYHVQ